MALIVGSNSSDSLAGTALADTMFGLDGNDTLNGGGGSDTMFGMVGNDFYIVDRASDVVHELAGEGVDTVSATVDYALDAGESIEVLRAGNASGLHLTGNELANTLIGGGGDDTLDGGAGFDTMTGGAGDDTFIFNSRSDIAVEVAGEGTDTILTSANVILQAGNSIEVVQATVGTGVQIIGNNRINQTLIGNAGDDDLRSGGVNATLIGGAGNDLYFIDADDTVVENAGAGIDRVFVDQGAAAGNSFTLGANLENLRANNVGASARAVLTGNTLDNTIEGFNADDTLSGLGGVDVLVGGAGNDRLDGGAGIDTMIGGTGDDTFIMDSRSDSIVEAAGEGRDTILTGANVLLQQGVAVEVVQVTRTGDTQVVGNDTANQTLIGNAGNDDLRSGGVGTTMIGGAGNDAYFTDGNDVLIENAGNGVDSVFFDQGAAAGSFTLGANLENLAAIRVGVAARAILTGNGLDNAVTGLSAADTLSGLGGNDTLDGLAGADTMTGGTGDDLYFVDNAADLVVELAGQGADTVRGSVDHQIAANVENLQLQGLANLSGAGNALVNILTGNGGNNALNGVGGGDTLVGGAGDDTYFVNAASDVVVENAGAGTDSIVALVANYTLTAANVEAATLGLAVNGELVGSGGNNTLTGNLGDNVLRGQGGGDSLAGLDGADILFGGTEADTLAGGLGADIFALLAGDGADRILDFEAGQGDTLAMAGFGVVTFAALQSHMSQQGADVLIDFGVQGSFRLDNTTLAEITAAQVALG